MIYVIVILVLIVVVIGIISIWISKARQKVREFSNLAWGTDSLSEGVRKMQQEYSETPKSVSAMTGLYLPKIKKDFPEFQYDEMKTRAENVLCSYLLSIDRNNPGELKEGNRELRDKLEMYISMLKGKGQREYYQKIKIHRTEISEYKKRDGRCIITFQSAIQFLYYMQDEQGKLLAGNKEMYTQEKYDIDVIYIQDREKIANELDLSLGVNCPNCGAPISGLGSKLCAYCQTPVVEINIYAWTFSNVRAVKQ